MYAVGDIHGELEELVDALSLIERDIRRRDNGDRRVIFLGDYVDRGPNSKAVVERLIKLRDSGLVDCIFLRGNHEVLMMDGEIGRTALGHKWLSLGGLKTCQSYGVATIDRPTASILNEFYAVLPSGHRDFFAQLNSFHHEKGYFFSHAGVNPELSLQSQPESALIWGSTGFLDYNQPLESIVVHGHYRTSVVTVKTHRIGVDTGCGFANGRLSVVALDNGACRVLTEGD